MRSVTERITCGLLNPSDTISSEGNATSMSVMDVLGSKHPEPLNPSLSALINSGNFPAFEEIEVTSSHVQVIAQRIQGGPGPRGCDAIHWQDALLHYGTHSERLRAA